jgi:molybdopterin converting factor small subunit
VREGIVSVPAAMVTVEFLGMARFRAGRSEVRARGGTVGELLRAVIAECPRLAGMIADGDKLSRQYLVSFEGERFVDDAAEPVPAGCRVLILGADAGG